MTPTTLVVSDLHLGSRLQRDVLRRPAARDALLSALDGIDRLVLLGDVVELLEGRPRVAMHAAEPVLRAIGDAVGKGREVVIVPGNHDHALVRPWIRARRHAHKRIGVATQLPAGSSRGLATIAGWLRPARVRVQYPGVWLAPRVWATHGHYLDRHLLPQEGWGARRLMGRVPVGHATPEDYEAAGGPSVAAMQALLVSSLPRVIAEPVDRAAGLARRAGSAAIPLAAALPGAAALAPITASALGTQFRRAGLPAMEEVVTRLGVHADHVLFGHLHRLGARDGDDPREWAPGNGPRLHNTGSWVYEPLLLTGAEPPHPYWPGGAVLVRDGEPPRTLALLDDASQPVLRTDE